jgi:uncharacterized alpha-E superfamily protein
MMMWKIFKKSYGDDESDIQLKSGVHTALAATSLVRGHITVDTWCEIGNLHLILQTRVLNEEFSFTIQIFQTSFLLNSEN